MNFDIPEEFIDLCKEHNVEVKDALEEAMELFELSLEQPVQIDLTYPEEEDYEMDSYEIELTCFEDWSS